jgi:hypothetical protein
MRELGLVAPQPAKGRAVRFKAEQRKWYSKLAKHKDPAYPKGFTDLEWVDYKTGKGQNSDYLRRSTNSGRPWRPEKAEFFRLVRNFVTHYEFKTKRDRVAMELLSEGYSFRRILKHLRRYNGYRKSLYSLFYYLHDLLKACQTFNLIHAEGLLNPANADAVTHDALLADLRMEHCYLGLPLDAGWFDENLHHYYERRRGN